MPLARYAMYAWGTQVYVAPTWDRGEPWLSTLRHIAKEGRAFVVGCCMTLRRRDIETKAADVLSFYKGLRDWINGGDSAIVDPDGNFVAGPLSREEGILYADIERARLRGPKWMLDVAGHYARPDVFELIVHTDERPLISPDGRAPAEPEKAPRRTGRQSRRKTARKR